MSNDPEDRWISSAGRPWAGRKPSERSLALAPSALPSLLLQLTMDPPWLSADVDWGDGVVNELIHLKNKGRVAKGKHLFDWKVYPYFYKRYRQKLLFDQFVKGYCLNNLMMPIRKSVGPRMEINHS